jgi:hypothetical protein
MRRMIAAAALALAAGTPGLAQQANLGINDYPTDARAEYVFACMAVNGNTQDVLRRCSCSIDVIASILPYERYVQAEAVLAMRQTSGERVGIVRETQPANEMVRDLRRAQAEGDVRCF